MTTHGLALFVAAGLLLNVTPGPDVLYIVGRAASQGRKAGFVSALGIGAGGLLHILAAVAGVSTLMMRLPAAYETVRWLGAARSALFDATRAHVAKSIGAPTDELDQMFDLVRSRVELSVERLLATVERSTRHR